MAFSLNGPEFEGEAGAQGVGGRDHARARQACGNGQMLEIELDQIRDKEKEPAKAGGKLAGQKLKGAHVSNSLNAGSGILRPLIVEPPRQRGESFFMEDLADGGGAEADAALFEDFADLVDRMVFLAQLDYSVPGRGLAGLGLRPPARRGKEAGLGIAAEMMTKDSEGPWRVSELSSYRVGGFVFDEKCPQGLILALLGQ